MSRQGYHRRRPWKGGGRASASSRCGRQNSVPPAPPPASPTPNSARPGSLRSRRPNQSSGAKELEPGGTSGRTHPGRGAGTRLRGATEMEPVRSRGWALGDEVQALGELRALRGASAGERDRVCSVLLSVFPATNAKFLGGCAPPPPGGLEKDPKPGLDF